MKTKKPTIADLLAEKILFIKKIGKSKLINKGKRKFIQLDITEVFNNLTPKQRKRLGFYLAGFEILGMQPVAALPTKLRLVSKQIGEEFFEFTNVTHLRANGNYCYVYFNNRVRFHCSVPLKTICKQLPHYQFGRVRSGVYVNRDFINHQIEFDGKTVTMTYDLKNPFMNTENVFDVSFLERPNFPIWLALKPDKLS